MSIALIIEDELGISETVAEIVGAAHPFSKVVRVFDGESGVKAALIHKPDLAIVDLGLPKLPGIVVLQHIHNALPATKICVISGDACTENKVLCLRSGADDYLLKPFSERELEARIHVLMRRGRLAVGNSIVVDGAFLYVEQRLLVRDGRLISLSAKESSLLSFLMANASNPVSRGELLDSVWPNQECFPNTVDACIESLRRKIDKPFKVKSIHTVYGVGYMYKVIS